MESLGESGHSKRRRKWIKIWEEKFQPFVSFYLPPRTQVDSILRSRVSHRLNIGSITPNLPLKAEFVSKSTEKDPADLAERRQLIKFGQF